MKRKLTTLCTMLLMGFITVWADTSIISNGIGGWEKITSIPSNVDEYYFVFVDNSQDLMLELRKGSHNANNALYYMTSKNPLINRSFLWTLEANSGDYAGMYSMRNVEYSSLMMQTEWDKGYAWDTNDQANPCEWTAVNMQYDSNNGYWTLENGKYPSSSDAAYKGYLGPWDENNNNTNLTSGQELAANKSDVYIGHFQIYTISKEDAATYYESIMASASIDEPVDVSFYINNREANLNEKDCWTTSGKVDRNNGSATYDGYAGFFEPSDWWASTFTSTMNQTVNLPNGRYQVETAAQASEGCKLKLSVSSGGNSVSATLSSKGDIGSSISSSGGWEWLNSGTILVSSGSLTITITSTASTQFNWGNVDGFRLFYLGSASNKDALLSQLASLLSTCAPYDDVTDVSDYTTYYNTYKNYDGNNSEEELQTAINYIKENFPNYQWTYASIAHPVDVTEGIITDADCTNNDNWNIGLTGRPTESAQDETGTTRILFYQNVEPDAVRGQTVTIPSTGAYMLKTWVRNVNNNANTYAKMAISDGAYNGTGTYANAEDIAAIYGNESTAWTQLTNYFATLSDNQQKTIYINLSHGGEGRKAYVSRMKLYYIGQNADFVKDGVHKYIGTFAESPAITLTDAIPVADITAATMTSASLTFTNPNGLVFASSVGQVSSTDKNVVVNGTCGSLQLEKGHPFVNPKEFTATAAKYTLGTGELADGKFATLMVPFAASVPSGGKAYTLDQRINLIDGNIYATEASSITANSPVLVTAAGDYSGSNVTVPVVASGATYTSGELVGIYTAMPAPVSSYVLQNHTSGEGVAFYLVGNTRPTVNPFRAYIKSQGSNVRAIHVVFDETDGIEDVQHSMSNVQRYYDLQGRRVVKPEKGLYIVNGRKTVIQ